MIWGYPHGKPSIVLDWSWTLSTKKLWIAWCLRLFMGFCRCRACPHTYFVCYLYVFCFCNSFGSFGPWTLVSLTSASSGWSQLPGMARVMQCEVYVEHEGPPKNTWGPLLIWLVVWNMFYFFHILGIITTNWRSHIFQRGRYTTNQCNYDEYVW